MFNKAGKHKQGRDYDFAVAATGNNTWLRRANLQQGCEKQNYNATLLQNVTILAETRQSDQNAAFCAAL